MSDQTATTAPAAAARDGEQRDSRLIIVFFIACVLVLLLSAALLLVAAARSVLATQEIAGFALSVAEIWPADSSGLAQIIPYAGGAFVLAWTAPLRRTHRVFWTAMALLFLVVASYHVLVWQAGEGGWIFNALSDTGMQERTDALRSFFAAMRNGAVVLMASMLGLAVNKDAKN